LAGINGKAALEGTFLGPCIITGRVAARSLLKELETPSLKDPLQESRCAVCHDIPKLLSKPRDGYWHFEKVHRATQDRGLDCRHCHSELTPYRKDKHHVNRQSLTSSCVLCHVAQE
ncbi:MAG: ifcA, partial [Planctomycetaceae bacterium]|nr:ifcA [Planctomycetaceae bacterium]